MPDRILLLRRGGLGDTLLTLPLLRALRRAHGGSVVYFAGVREFGDVLAAFGACERAFSSEDLTLWDPERASARLAGYDLVIGDDAAAHVVIDPRRVAPDVPFGLQLARQAGLEPRWPEDGWLRAPSSVGGNGSTVLAPGSGGRSKCWPRARWLELAGRIEGPIEVVVGPAEQERDDPRTWSWPRDVTFLAGLTLTELANRLANARRFVGNDSGPTHLAACLGVPTTAIFGASDPAVWAPVGPHVDVVGEFGRELTDVTVDEVVQSQNGAGFS